jgi:glutaredoxin
MQEKLRVVLYTKPGCGLCEKMKREMQSAGIPNLYTLEEVDIETDTQLFAQYRYEIPVLLINGVEAFRHRLTAEEFRAYVTSLLRNN